MKQTHTIDKARFHQAMINRGWNLDGPSGTWIAPSGSTRTSMEKDWSAALIEAITCPHEEAGVE